MTRRFVDSLFTGGVILRRKFLTFALSLVILCALVFELYPRSSQKIDLSTGAGISKMLRYENAQVYLFGETHRCTEYQQFRNALFQYLVKEKGVRVLVEESGYATAFLENETVQGRLPVRIGLIGARSPKRTISCIHGLPTGTAAGMLQKKFQSSGSTLQMMSVTYRRFVSIC